MKSYTWFLVLSGVLGLLLGVYVHQRLPVIVEIRLQTLLSGQTQLFFDTGSGFTESQSVRAALRPSAEAGFYRFHFRGFGVRTLRLDPVEFVGDFTIERATVSYSLWTTEWNAENEKLSLNPANQLTAQRSPRGIIASSTGNDPYFLVGGVDKLAAVQMIMFVVLASAGAASGVGVGRLLARRDRRSNQRAQLLIVLVVAASVRLIYWADSGLPVSASEIGRMWPDEGTYFSISTFVIENGLLAYATAEKSVWTAPGNPLYLALTYSITESIQAIRVLNMVLSCIAIALTYALGKQWFDHNVGIVAAGVCALHAQLIQYSSTLLTEPLFVFCLTGALLLLVRSLDSNDTRSQYLNAVASGLLMTAAVLTRSSAALIPLALLCAVALNYVLGRSRGPHRFSGKLVTAVFLALLAPVIVTGALVLKNKVIFDQMVFATGSGAALWLGSRPDTEGDEPPYRGKNYDTELITKGKSHLSLEGDALLLEAAKQNIDENTADYLWWNVKKIGRLLVGSDAAWFFPVRDLVSWMNWHGYGVADAAWMVVQILLASFVAIGGSLGLIVARGRAMTHWLVSGLIIYMVLISLPFLAIQRYGVPIFPFLAIPASALAISAVNGAYVSRIWSFVPALVSVGVAFKLSI